MGILMKYSRNWFSIFCVILLLSSIPLPALTVQADSNKIYHVKEGGAGTLDGSSWANAFDSLQTALEAVQAGDEIWIAKGTYYPTKAIETNDDRTKTFQMKNGVAIYGGFTGTNDNETVPDRDWTTNKTILSGDLEKNDDSDDSSTKEDNAYHVFYHPEGTSLDNTAILDGVSIVGGNASGMTPHAHGGGMYNDGSSPTLTNVTVSGNNASNGGAMWNRRSSPSLTNVTISGNSADNLGGGMYNTDSSPSLTNVTISGNTSNYAGGMFNNDSSSPSLTNVTISGNTANYAGGGMFNNDSSSPSLTNVTISGNNASYGGGCITIIVALL